MLIGRPGVISVCSVIKKKKKEGKKRREIRWADKIRANHVL